MPILEVDALAFIETARYRVERVIKAIATMRGHGVAVDADAVGHGVVFIPSARAWMKTGQVVSPLGAVCLDMQPGDEDDVLQATSKALLVSHGFAAGMDDGTRARPDAEMVDDASYLRGLEFGYEVRFYAKRPGGAPAPAPAPDPDDDSEDEHEPSQAARQPLRLVE